MKFLKISMITFILIFPLLYCSNSISDIRLIGKWKEVKITTQSGETGEKYTYDNKPWNAVFLIEFYKNGTAKEYVSNTETSFSLKDSILIIGDRKYKLNKLNDNEFIYEETEFRLHHFIKVQDFTITDIEARRNL